MTDNDFVLFPTHDADVDGDIALVTAYLAHELTGVQIAAVEERLATDAAFRERVMPVIQGWTLPRSFADTTAARPVLPVRTARRWSMARIAAVITAIVIPLVASAQLVRWAAKNPDAPGHKVALAITPAGSDVRRGLELLVSAQQQVAVVEVSRATAQTTEPLASVFGVREAPDGRVLVNDPLSRQVRLFDPTLTKWTIALDSIPGSAASYGMNPAPLVPYVRDSMLFTDDRAGSMSGTMVVLDAFGRVARSLALVRVKSGAVVGNLRGVMYTEGELPENAIASSPGAGVDAQGRLVYRAQSIGGKGQLTVPRGVPMRQRPMPGGGGRAGAAGAPPGVMVNINDRPDSLAVLRMDLSARRVDTVGFVKQPPHLTSGPDLAVGGGKMVAIYGTNGDPVSAKQVINPLYPVDDFAVLSDGTIAFVRGTDYHVDWIHPDGSRTSSPKLPFDWKPLNEADKQRLIDSTRAAIDSVDAFIVAAAKCADHVGDSIVLANGGGTTGFAEYQRLRNAGLLPPDPPCAGDNVSIGPVENRLRIAALRGADLGPTQPSALRGERRFPYEIVPPSEIADYYPPIKIGSLRPDRDGNLWILPRSTSLSKAGELVYDVVNPKGGLIQRVRLPQGRTIAGFGKGGVVYLQLGNIKSGFLLERVTVAGLTPKG
jgi:hypothetical protein